MTAGSPLGMTAGSPLGMTARLDDSRVISGDAEQLDFESERLVRRDGVARAFRAVGELGRDDEAALAADFHAAQAFFPAVHDFFLAEGELEGILFFAAAIELRAVGEPAGVVDDDVAAGGRGAAFAEDSVFEGHAARGGGDGGHGSSFFGEGG